jgi:hypothetical protein
MRTLCALVVSLSVRLVTPAANSPLDSGAAAHTHWPCAAATASIAVPMATPATLPVELVHAATSLSRGLRRQRPVLWYQNPTLFVLVVSLSVRLVTPAANYPLDSGAAAHSLRRCAVVTVYTVALMDTPATFPKEHAVKKTSPCLGQRRT